MKQSTSILKEIHSDHEGHWSHPRTMGTITTVASVIMAFILVFLEAYVRQGMIIPGVALVGAMLGAKTAETFAAQRRASNEKIAAMNVFPQLQGKNEHKHELSSQDPRQKREDDKERTEKLSRPAPKRPKSRKQVA